MVVLTEQIEIPASYEKMEAWTANFEEEFVKWSPYHIECNLYNGNYHAGSKVRFREIVMGLDYDVTGTITECEQDENHFRVVFRSDKKTAFITFEGKRTETGCHCLSRPARGGTVGPGKSQPGRAHSPVDPQVGEEPESCHGGPDGRPTGEPHHDAVRPGTAGDMRQRPGGCCQEWPGDSTGERSGGNQAAGPGEFL